MTRRHFLTSAWQTSLSFGVLGVTPFFSSSESRIDLLANPELLSVLDSEREVLRIGRSYRERYREEDDAKLLQQKIEAALKSTLFGARPSLKTAITADFEQGNTRQIHGWILSITEARQCALYSLLHS